MVNNDILAGWVWGSSGVVRALVLLRRFEALRGLRIAAHLLKSSEKHSGDTNPKWQFTVDFPIKNGDFP